MEYKKGDYFKERAPNLIRSFMIPSKYWGESNQMQWVEQKPAFQWVKKWEVGKDGKTAAMDNSSEKSGFEVELRKW